MSGPKISVYELTGWARKIVFEQIRFEQASIVCAEQIKNLVQEATSFRDELNNILAKNELMQSRNIASDVSSTQITRLLVKLEHETEDILDTLCANMPHVSPKYTISDAALAEKKELLVKLKVLKKRVVALRDELDKVIYESRGQSSESTKQIERSIADDTSGSVSFEYFETGSSDEHENSISSVRSEIEAKLRILSFDKKIPETMQSEIVQALSLLNRVSSIEHLRSFNAVTVKGLEQKAAQYKIKQAIQLVAFREEYERYRTLCQMAEIEAKPYEFSPDSVTSLKDDITRLERVLVKQHEQTYISECVDLVMSDMGYELIGIRDVKKRNGRKFHNELYTFNEGTGVNITYSSDGQIAMELGGLSREDRIPSDEEAKTLTEDMERFCGEFAEFERRMREKGIVLGSRITLSPPFAEYAAIINVSEYDIDDSKRISEMNVAEKKHRKIEKKTMQREEG